MLNPILFFALIWLVQLLGYLFYRSSFGAYENETILVVLLGFVSFLCGAFLAQLKSFSIAAILIRKMPQVLVSGQSQNRTGPAVIFCAVYTLIGILICIKLISLISENTAVSVSSFTQLREAVNQDFLGPRIFYNYFRYFQMGIVLIIFLFCFMQSISKRVLYVLFGIGLVSVLITTSRLILLFYILSIIAVLFSFKKISAKQIVMGLGGFLVLFFGLAVLMKKGYDNFDKPVELLKWNIQVYLFSPLAAFNSFVKAGVPDFDTLVTLPNIVKKIINQLFDTNLTMRPNLMPFVSVPVRTNVYTFFFPLYHDGGKALVTVGCLIMGYVHQSLFVISSSRQTPIVVYLFCISLYPLAMTFFEDAYFSSPGFLVLQMLPIVIFGLWSVLKTNTLRDEA